LKKILVESDDVMVARGDLAVEVPFKKLSLFTEKYY
jgi:pyruvate kinase